VFPPLQSARLCLLTLLLAMLPALAALNTAAHAEPSQPLNDLEYCDPTVPFEQTLTTPSGATNDEILRRLQATEARLIALELQPIPPSNDADVSGILIAPDE
jgi:hypothetical protein